MSDRETTPDLMARLSGLKVGAETPAASPQQVASEDEQKRKIERDRGRKRSKNLAHYDLIEGMKEKIAEESIRLGIPASQLASFLLADALARFDAGKIDPNPYVVPSTSPRFRNNLDFDWNG